ncbi:hypothetical protein [Actinokineospora sp.]|uniref:hypothetical protein n=1 Tax=Actinokineospora sp. TaxID=1872133 RepID=UPI004037B9C4
MTQGGLPRYSSAAEGEINMVDVRAKRLVPDQIQGRNPHHVNHDDELDTAMAVARRGNGNQIVVLAGSPGVGKTATGLELSHRLRGEFPDGRLFGRLSTGLDEPGVESEILGDFLGALGVAPQDIPARQDARKAKFQAMTAGGRYQVFLDGAVTASQVRTLLPGDGESLVVVTEGRPLSTLSADSPVTFLDLSPLLERPARELLGRITGADRVAAEPAAVGEVIRLCGHLPIALCVVGALVARSRGRTFASVVERLRDERGRLATLSSNEDLSVTSVFTAAYRLLGDTAQVCYRALGLRPRCAEIGADALAAALDLPNYEVVEALTELADARLVDEIAADRVGVRELVRLHAEQLDQRPAGERDAETARLLRYYLTHTAAADDLVSPRRPWRDSMFPGLERAEPFADEAAARSWLRIERANLCSALEHAYDIGEFAMVVRWCVLLWPFYEKEKCLGDLFATHDLGLKAARRLSDAATESLIHSQRGFAHYWLRDLDDAVKAFEAGVRLATSVGRIDLEATAAEGLGLARLDQGKADEASTVLKHNLDLAVRIGDERRVALAKFHLAKALAPRFALALLYEAGQAFAGEPENLAKVAIWRGRKYVDDDKVDGVEPDLVHALDVMASRGRRFDQAHALVVLGDLAVRQEDASKAAESYQEALTILDDLGFAAAAVEVRTKLTAMR